MPILDIEIVLRPGEALPPSLAADLAAAAAEAMGASPGRTWVKLSRFAAEDYAEDGAGPAEPVYPIFVRVLKAQRPMGAELQVEALRLTEAIARACNRPGANVHVLYEPHAEGRLAFGGQLVLG